jgi:ABC-type oligopeptide transport system ATPase subunit
MAFNEEDIKVKMVLDWLLRNGVQQHEVSFESSFHFKAGRYTFRVETEQQVRALEPRLDMLVKRNGINLLIVEVKSESQEIDQDDALQAISYARLVHPIAPYALVLNGRDSRLYDTYSRDPVPIGGFRLQERYTPTLPDDLIYEALRIFLSLSPANLRAFCEKQVEDHIEPLVGSREDPTRKFIPEINVTRGGFLDQVTKFLETDVPVFALIGESGSGKTSAFCELARIKVNQGQPVLLYQGRGLESDILRAVADDFSWAFSEQHSPIQLIKRLEGVVRGGLLLVLVDAIDEWPNSTRVQHLVNLSRNLKDKPIKLLVSCKTSAWDSFLLDLGSPTGLDRFVYREVSERVGCQLDSMTPREFYSAVERYRDFFGFQGAFETGVLEEAKRNPFLLRVLFQVAAKAGLEHITFSSKEIFDEYLQQVVKKTSAPSLGQAHLLAIAGALYSANKDQLEVGELRSRMGLGVNEPLMEELFLYNVLSRAFAKEEEAIGFYFSKLRDYLVAFKILRWHELSPADFAEATAGLGPGVRGEVLSFYYRYAPLEQKKVLDGEVRALVEAYLDFYVEIIAEHFSAFKDREKSA